MPGPSTPVGPSPIEDYGLIGDCYSAALVSRGGSIDWLCWPRFDSAACFAALLGTSDNGRWLICPAATDATSSRAYRDGSVVLETRFKTADGEVALIDFMPIGVANSALVRIVRGLQRARRDADGVGVAVRLRGDRALGQPAGGGRAESQAIAGPDMAVLRSPVRLVGRDMRTVAEFEVAAGRELSRSCLSYGPEPRGRAGRDRSRLAELAQDRGLLGRVVRPHARMTGRTGRR